MNGTATLDDYHWLIGDEAAACLTELAENSPGLLRATEQLRRTLSPQRAGLALKLVELRRRARDKFTDAARMFFTTLSLEQATDQWVAHHKAARLPDGAAMADFCCGIGGDLLALASRGPVVGVDRDPNVALLAEANARVCGVKATLHVADTESIHVGEFAAWHLDPDRRPAGRRTSRVEFGSPPLPTIAAMLLANPQAAIKLSPAAEVPEDWTANAELEWISSGGECRQQVAWFGALARNPGGRRATAIRQGVSSATFLGEPEVPLQVIPRAGRYLFEPDAAVLGAHLTGALAAAHQLSALAVDVAYLTSDTAPAEPLLTAFEVLELLPLDLKQVRAALRSRSVGQLEIKKRGVPHDPADVLRRLKPDGPEEATLFLTRTALGPRAIIARRMKRPSVEK